MADILDPRFAGPRMVITEDNPDGSPKSWYYTSYIMPALDVPADAIPEGTHPLILSDQYVVNQQANLVPGPSVPPGGGQTVTTPSGTAIVFPNPTDAPVQTPVTEKKTYVAPKQDEGKTMTDDEKVLAMAGGDGYWTYDQWGYFYFQALGKAAPAPEDVGLQRNSAGEVVINGQTQVNYATWKAVAFPSGVPSGPSGGGTSGGGGGGATQAGVLDQLKAMLIAILRWLVGGGYAGGKAV